jgi:hypothetical protein
MSKLLAVGTKVRVVDGPGYFTGDLRGSEGVVHGHGTMTHEYGGTWAVVLVTLDDKGDTRAIVSDCLAVAQ